MGGAHNDHDAAAETVKEGLIRHLEELLAIDPEERLRLRYEKFRNMGRFIEDAPAAA
jgi:acetyl-CoA carboxylase carboxyl transferase subunit alpha